MTSPDLAGIIERDRQTAPFPRRPQPYLQAAADRRALLALLRETREAAWAVLRDSMEEHGSCQPDDPCTVAVLRAALSALAEP